MSLISTADLRPYLGAAGKVKLGRAATHLSHRMSEGTGTYDIFLSHSYRDHELVGAVRAFLIDQYDYTVYVDWIESPQLDRTRVTARTAQALKTAMNRCGCLMFLTTDNAVASKWMPWELGYFDALRDGRVAILPIAATNPHGNTYVGQEYLGIYPYIVRGKSTTQAELLWVHQDASCYVSLREWVNGREPYRR